MKNLRLIGFLMMLASSALFVNCTSDPVTGDNGTAGIDGIDGIAGIDGLDSTEDCRSCHSNKHRDPIKADYALSAHATGDAYLRGTSDRCAQCHNNAGFVDFASTGAVQAGGYAESNPITCTGCHDIDNGHRSFDFANDGNDYALRTFAPVTLMVDASVTLDATNDSDALGASNACIACHQPRRSGPDPSDADFTITSSHWGPHYGAQSTLLEGIQGFEFSTAGISAAGTARHSEKSSCIACHMSEGGHTWEPSTPSSATCTQCHTSGAPESVDGFATSMATLVAELETVVGWEYKYSVLRDGSDNIVYAADRDGNLTELQFLDKDGVVTDDDDFYVIETDSNGDKIKLDVVGPLHGGHPNVGFYGQGATFTTAEAGAAWNYLFLNADNSQGVHNPNYAKALLAQSIEALQ